ncbi:hypothetical protein C3399_26825 [Enterobacter cloacae complex sp. ECNIH14]|nr:hypothetical protein C3399_26825 [Enterobacter cloacae complex sp. ECNIH14]
MGRNDLLIRTFLRGSSIVYLLLVLKTFIFNIYAIIMNSIRWEYHIKAQDIAKKRKVAAEQHGDE